MPMDPQDDFARSYDLLKAIEDARKAIDRSTQLSVGEKKEAHAVVDSGFRDDLLGALESLAP